MTLFRRFILSSCLLLMLTAASADELRLAGRSVQEAFSDDGVVKLLRAAAKQNIKEAKHLLDSGVDINALGKDGATPLVWMLGLKNLGGVKLLLDLGANPNQFVVDGVGPPVWLSAGGGQKEALQLLLDHGGDPNLSYGTRSPLMMAINGSHLDCAELLLQHGADINYSNGPLSALSSATFHVQFGDALWVLNHGYTHDLPMAKRMLEIKNPRPGQEEFKTKALEIVDRLLAEQQKP